MQVTSVSFTSQLFQSHTDPDAKVIFTHFHKKQEHGEPHVICVEFPEDLWEYETLSPCMYRALPGPSLFCKMTPWLLKGMVQPTLKLCKFASEEIHPEALGCACTPPTSSGGYRELQSALRTVRDQVTNTTHGPEMPQEALESRVRHF